MSNKNILNFLGCDCGYPEAQTVIFGAPFDGTTSYRPGTRFAPGVMRAESFGLETYSPYLGRDLTEIKTFDAGDLELPFGNAERALDIIYLKTKKILADGKRPFLLGGEHLVTLGAVRAAAEAYPGLCLLHFDAHADLRCDYLGEKLSHACVIRRAWELLGDKKIFQFGIRSGEKSEFAFAEEHTSLNKYNLDGLEEAVGFLAGKPVYVTIDLDILDPSVFPGTGTPEPGGVTFTEFLTALKALSRLKNMVACDIVELSPPYDRSGISTAAACKVLRELLLAGY